MSVKIVECEPKMFRREGNLEKFFEDDFSVIEGNDKVIRLRYKKRNATTLKFDRFFTLKDGKGKYKVIDVIFESGNGKLDLKEFISNLISEGYGVSIAFARCRYLNVGKYDKIEK